MHFGIGLSVIVTFFDSFDFVFLLSETVLLRSAILPLIIIVPMFACLLRPTLLLFALSYTDFLTTRQAACPLSRWGGDVPVFFLPL